MIWRKAQPSADVVDKPKGFDDYDVRLGDLMRGERATLGKSLLDVQRDLKIKATYIAAIENADVSAFESPGFIAGYVRSYARYLGMDPEWAYGKFCQEAGFAVTTALGPIGGGQRPVTSRPRPASQGLDALADPNAVFVPRGESFLTHVEPRAVVSVLVLVALIGGIGYGGWSVLREVQRVQVAPVEQSPTVAATIDPLGNVGTGTGLRIAEAERPRTPTLEALGQMTRPQALETPVLVPRDGPISTIDPRRSDPEADVALILDAVQDSVRVLAEAAPEVEIFAVSPSWVRVRAADGTVLFEKVLDAGESYVVPQAEVPPTLRAGNSGSVYFMVKGQAFGPAAPGAQVVSNIALSPESLTESFAAVDLEAAPAVARIVELAQSRLLGTPPQE
jgi:cytoskeletal protein RodZ